MEKPNCWQYMRCGREPGGRRAGAAGVCPASTFEPFDRINGGRAAGRVCWAVDNTLCSGRSMGHFSKKLDLCGKCLFYRMVIKQEGREVTLSIDILSRIEERVKSLPYTGLVNMDKWPGKL